MKTNLRGSTAFFNAPGEQGGAAAAAPPAAAAPATPAAAPGAPPQSQPLAVPGAAAPPAAGEPSAQPAAADYWPEGLDQKYKGADAKTTLDNLAKDLKGYRDRDATRGVPEKPEGYTNFEALKDFKIDEAQKPFFDALKTDPIFKGALEVMHKHGMGQLAVAETYQAFLKTAADAGMLEKPLDIAAELKALVPEVARSLSEPEQQAAVQKRIGENYSFLDLAVQNMGMPKEVRDHMEYALGDSAKGHAAFEWMRQRIQAGGAQPPGAIGGASGGVTRESLRAEMAALDRNAPDYAAKSAALDEKYKAFIGN